MINQQKNYSKKDITFKVDGTELEGTLFMVNKSDSPSVLILGGGANIPHNEGYYPELQEKMANFGVNSLAFDFRGVGNTKTLLSETSLYTRLKDAKDALHLLRKESLPGKVYLVGVSMGVATALQLTNTTTINGLIMVSPAAYSQESRDKKFGPEFTKATSKPNSWEGSPDFELLRQFVGKILLAFGEQDSVIPKPILNEYKQIVQQKGTVLEFEKVGHRFMREDNVQSIAAREKFCSVLEEFVK